MSGQNLLQGLGYGDDTSKNERIYQNSPYVNSNFSIPNSIGKTSKQENDNNTMNGNKSSQNTGNKSFIPQMSATVNKTFGFTRFTNLGSITSNDGNNEFKINDDNDETIDLDNINTNIMNNNNNNNTHNNMTSFGGSKDLSPIHQNRINPNRTQIPSASIYTNKTNIFINNNQTNDDIKVDPDEMDMNTNPANNNNINNNNNNNNINMSNNINNSYIQRKLERSNIVLNPTKISVIGYPISDKMFILKKFVHYGRILNHFSINNVMYIEYSNTIEAQRALAENGKWIKHNYLKYMIAVTYQENTEFDHEINNQNKSNINKSNNNSLNNISNNNYNNNISGSISNNNSLNNISLNNFGTMQTGRFMNLNEITNINDNTNINNNESFTSKIYNFLTKGW